MRAVGAFGCATKVLCTVPRSMTNQESAVIKYVLRRQLQQGIRCCPTGRDRRNTLRPALNFACQRQSQWASREFQGHGPLDQTRTSPPRPLAISLRRLALLLVLTAGTGLASAAPAPATAPQVDPTSVASDRTEPTGNGATCHHHRAADLPCQADTVPSSGSPPLAAPSSAALLPRPAAVGVAHSDLRAAPTHPVPLYLRLHRLLVAHSA